MSRVPFLNMEKMESENGYYMNKVPYTSHPTHLLSHGAFQINDFM